MAQSDLHQTDQTVAEAATEQRALSGRNQPTKRRGSLLPLVLVAGLILVAGIAWSLHTRRTASERLRETTAASATRTVAVVRPKALGTAEEITLPGSAQAFQDTAIYARTSGYLKSWRVDIGQHVKAGELLAEIETPEVDRQLEQTRAELKNAQANLDLARLTSARSENLMKSHTISQQERDQAALDLSSKQALVASGEANVKRLEQLQSFQKIYAPFEGVITARNTDVGALIQAGDNTTAKELFHLADNHILRIYFSVPEVYAAGVKDDEETPIQFDAFPGKTFAGKIVRNSATIDPHSHTLMVEADIENSEGRLLPGGYAMVHLKLPATSGTFTVPANTLLFRAEGTRVAAVRGGRIALVPVAIGRDHGNTLEITSQVTEQDELVLDPPDSLAEGEPAVVEPGTAGEK